MKVWLRLGLMLAGLALFAWFVARADLGAVGQAFQRLGGLAPLALLPYVLVYVADTAAWRVAFPASPAVGFGRLLRVRWSGEAVNNVVPSAYLGGEAVKVFLLRRRGVPLGVGTTAAVVSKSAQTLAQVLFIGAGALAFAWIAPGNGGLHRAMLAVVGLSTLTLIALFWLQRRGLFTSLMRAGERLGLRLRVLAEHRGRLEQLDRQIGAFYREHQRRFLACVGVYWLGWLLDAVEIFVVAHLMGVEMTWQQALAVEAFISVAKVLGVFVPGAVGVQESGVVLLGRLAGLPEPFALAYALFRRGRELLYAAVGWTWLYLEEASLPRLRREVTELTKG